MNTKAYSLVGRWRCKRAADCENAPHVELRTTLDPRTGAIVETFTYACGHSVQRIVGALRSARYFEDIERRFALSIGESRT